MRRIVIFESLIIRLVIGAIAGWLAGQIVKGYGLGLVGNIVVGIIGAIIAGWLLPMIGFVLVGGILAAIVNAVIGAVILLIIVGFSRNSADPRQRANARWLGRSPSRRYRRAFALGGMRLRLP